MNLASILTLLATLFTGIAFGYGWATLRRRSDEPDVDRPGAARALLLDAVRYQEQAARIPALEGEVRTMAEQLAQSREKVAAVEAQLVAEKGRQEEQVALLTGAREELSGHFKILATEILEDRAARFTEQNKAGLGAILEPLKTRLGEFQKKVEDVYVQEGKDRAALGEQVKHLLELNQTLSQEAHGLTQALKGSSKTQGIWGEMVLETILEAAGLRKGEEYELRPTVHWDDGNRVQPDVLVKLPDGKTIVVDSKASLTAYEQYANSDDGQARGNALKSHLVSVRNHIAELSNKRYQNLPGGERFDAVVMFIPLEPAFMAAIGADSKLWEEAWAKNVLLVGPSTLLFVLRTVRLLWNQEQQSQNAQEIAKRGAELYDKLAGFVADFQAIGDRLAKASDAYQSAMGKFSTGKGNAIRQAQMLKELGVNPTKILPSAVVQASESELEVI